MENNHLSEKAFKHFDIHPLVLQGIEDSGFEYCTPIQAISLPKALKGEDVMGQAQTGTGKTAAFLIAVMNWLLRNPVNDDREILPKAIIIAPTRELALQIHKDAEVLGKHTGLRLGLVYGGANYEGQRQQLEQGVDVLIGTPGRIIDYHKQRIFSLKGIQAMVLDEADRMFDLGFIKDIRFLLRRMPPPQQRLNMLFSATLSFKVTELAYEHMNNPSSIEIERDRITADHIKETVYYTANNEKIPLLIYLLQQSGIERCMVFVNTKHGADRVCSHLKGNDIKAEVLSGDVRQNKRQSILKQFSSGELPVLVATDIAARGIHVEGLSHIINFDLPQDQEDYVHRIGRTGRAGASGNAISFACETYSYSLPEIEEYIGYKIPSEPVPAEVLAMELKPPVKREKRDGPPRHRSGRNSGGGRRRHGGGGKPRK